LLHVRSNKEDRKTDELIHNRTSRGHQRRDDCFTLGVIKRIEKQMNLLTLEGTESIENERIGSYVGGK
jgi:hypothetical protein